MKTSNNFHIVVQVRSFQRVVLDRKRNKWNFVEAYETNETYFIELYQGSSVCSNRSGMSLVTCIPGNIFAKKLELICKARKISNHTNYLIVGNLIAVI